MAATENPARAALWYGASLYLNSALLFIATPIFTRLLLPSEYGTVVLYTSWSMVLTIVATLSLSSGIFYNAMQDFSGNQSEYIASMVLLCAVSVLVSYVVLHIVETFAGPIVALDAKLVSYMFAYFLFATAFSFWQASERYNFRYKLLSAVSIFCSVVGVLGALLFVKSFEQFRVVSRIVMPTLPIAIAGLVVSVFFMRSFRADMLIEHWKYALRFSIPLLPHYGAQALFLQIDRLSIEHIFGRSELGVYGLAIAVASALTLFWTAINSSLAPWALRALSDGRTVDIRHRTIQILAAVACAAIFVALFADELVSVLAPEKYSGARAVVPVLVAASFVQFSQACLLNIQFFRKRVVLISVVSLAAAVTNVSLNYLFLPALGYEWAARFFLCGMLVQLILHSFLIWRSQDRAAAPVGPMMVTNIAVLAACGVLTVFHPTIMYKVLALAGGLIVLCIIAARAGWLERFRMRGTI